MIAKTRQSLKFSAW